MVNRILRLFATTGLIAAALTLSQSSARAAFTFTATPGGSAQSGATYSSLDGRVAGSAGTQTTASGLTVSFSGGGQFVQGSSPNQYQAPLISGNNNMFFETTPPPATPTADTTVYGSTGTGSAAFTFAGGAMNYFGILWGSVDSYNSLIFTFVDNSTTTITGSQIMAISGPSMDGTAYVNINSTLAFTMVTAMSTQNSFEFDNVAFGAVPEPSSLALCGIAGVVGSVVARKRLKRAVA